MSTPADILTEPIRTIPDPVAYAYRKVDTMNLLDHFHGMVAMYAYNGPGRREVIEHVERVIAAKRRERGEEVGENV